MTKLRGPITYDAALARIAGLIGWAAMATATARAERTVRNWGDPDATESCPIECAELLDLAFQAAGGDGAPMFETYARRLDIARAERFADERQLSIFTGMLAKEAGEAVAALITASMPGACARDRTNAAQQVEELLNATTSTLPLLMGPGLIGTPGRDGS